MTTKLREIAERWKANESVWGMTQQQRDIACLLNAVVEAEERRIMRNCRLKTHRVCIKGDHKQEAFRELDLVGVGLGEV